MKFIADENLGSQVPRYLKEQGIDIISIKELATGLPDIEVLEIANQQERILIRRKTSKYARQKVKKKEKK